MWILACTVYISISWVWNRHVCCRAFIRSRWPAKFAPYSTSHRRLLKKIFKFFFFLPLVDCTYPISKMIKLTKKAIELLDAVTSVLFSRKGLGYTIGRGLDSVLPFTCYSNWFSCYFDSEQNSTTDLSRRHHLYSFSQELWYGWETIWRRVVHINQLNNVSSNFFHIMLSSLADDATKNPRWWRWGWMS
jgi:hypothetical protein